MPSRLCPSPDDPEILCTRTPGFAGLTFEEPMVCTGGAASDRRWAHHHGVLPVFSGVPIVWSPGRGSLSSSLFEVPRRCRRDDWTEGQEIVRHRDCHAFGPSILRDREGSSGFSILGLFAVSGWTVSPPIGPISNVWCIRSYDDGITWVDRNCIFEGYCGATRGAIQVATGEIVVPISYVVRNPGRYLSACLVTRDRGETWKLDGSVDIGQCGDHAGAVEPSVVELRDGRLWMLIRTNLGYFMDSYSSDLGRYLVVAGCTPLSPVRVLRAACSDLSSGRIALAWNNTMDRAASVEADADKEFSGNSIDMNLRDALSIAFSDDEGDTWSPSGRNRQVDPIVLSAAAGDSAGRDPVRLPEGRVRLGSPAPGQSVAPRGRFLS